MQKRRLIELASDPEVKSVQKFGAVASRIGEEEIAERFVAELRAAPRRHARGKSYFVGHSGIPGSGARTNRSEEHLAIALYNDFGPGQAGLLLPDRGALRILDYQFPLKAARGDERVGKVDLLGLLPDRRLALIELKYLPPGKKVSGADTPLRAMLEGLAYCAIVQANLDDIIAEARDAGISSIEPLPPALLVLGNDFYWKSYRGSAPAGDWMPAVNRLAAEIADLLQTPIQFLSISDGEPIYQDGMPRCAQPPLLREISLAAPD